MLILTLYSIITMLNPADHTNNHTSTTPRTISNCPIPYHFSLNSLNSLPHLLNPLPL